LKSITLPVKVQKLGQHAFSFSGLEKMVFPKVLSSIHYTTFINCLDLTWIDVVPENTGFDSIEGVLFNEDHSIIYLYPSSHSGNCYEIPYGVTRINEFCFTKTRYLEYLTIPSTTRTLFLGIESQGSSLKYVTYQGTVAPSNCGVGTTVKVCVPPTYSSDYFCGTYWKTFSADCLSLSSECYDSSCVDGYFVQKKTQKALDIESQSFGCVHYECVNSTGKSTTVLSCEEKGCHNSQCNSENGECLYKKIDGYEELESQQNECYEVACNGTQWVLSKTEKALEIEKNSYGCVHYECDSSTGGSKVTTFCEERACYNSICNETSGDCSYEEIDGYEEKKAMENDCFKVVCNGESWELQKMDNATIVEEESDGCIAHQCTLDEGLIHSSDCVSTEDMNRACIQEECVENRIEDMVERPRVSIEITVRIRVNEVNTSDIINSIVMLTTIQLEKRQVGYEIDREGFVIRIIIYVDNKEIADTILRALKGITKEGCVYGLFCETKNIETLGVVTEQDISVASSIHTMTMSLILMFLFIITNVFM